MVLPGEREPAVGGQHLVPLVHVNDLGQSQAEHHHQGGVVQRGGSRRGNIAMFVLMKCLYMRYYIRNLTG